MRMPRWFSRMNCSASTVSISPVCSGRDEIEIRSARDRNRPPICTRTGRAKVTRVRRRSFVGLGAAAAAGAGIAVAGGVGLGRRVEGAAAETREELDGYAVASPGPMPSGVHHLVWSVATSERAAALTFDDGPDPE